MAAKNKRKKTTGRKNNLPKAIGIIEYLQFLLLLFGVIALVMLFVPAVLFGSSQSFNGVEIVFGYRIDPVIILKFHFLMFLGYFSLIYMAIIAFFPIKKYNTIKYFGIAILLFIAGTLLITLPSSLPASFGELSFDGIHQDIYEDFILRMMVTPIFRAMNENPPVMAFGSIVVSVLNYLGGLIALLLAKKCNMRKNSL